MGKQRKWFTDRELKFIDYYVEKPDATRAAKLAGYTIKGAGAQGCRLLRTEKIQAAINEKRETLLKKPWAEMEDWIKDIRKLFLTTKSDSCKIECLKIGGRARGYLVEQPVTAQLSIYQKLELEKVLLEDSPVNNTPTFEPIKELTKSSALEVAKVGDLEQTQTKVSFPSESALPMANQGEAGCSNGK